MEEITGWRKSAEAKKIAAHPPRAAQGGGSAGVADKAAAADAATDTFFRLRRLGPADSLHDGFRDAGGQRDPRLGSNPSAPSTGSSSIVLLVDRTLDRRLSEFVDSVAKHLKKGSDSVTRLMVTALLVSEALGRSGKDVRALEQRCEDAILQRGGVDGDSCGAGAVPLGDLLADKKGGSAVRDGRGKQQGAGGVRHRAVLFKALCDWHAIAPCTLVRGTPQLGSITWNLVTVDGSSYVVDVVFDPGALYEEDSPRAAEYLARLRQQGSSSAAPSAQESMKGRMVRPPWHVEPWELEFERSDRAGRGGFGEVFRGTWAGQHVAVKEVRDTSPTDGEVCNFILEIALLSTLSHPNIVRFWRGCVDLRGGHRTLLLITEWMDRGVLSELLHEDQDTVLSRDQCYVIASMVARGAGYLHEVGVLHLDLKSPNVLLNSCFQVKLCDFGLAKIREQVGANTTLLGVSPVWAPPEMFDDSHGGITEKADVYSFGIILFELFTREIPFSEMGQQMHLTRAKAMGQLPKFPTSLDGETTDFLRHCLDKRPANRVTIQGAIDQLRQMAKLRGVDLQEVHRQMEAQGLKASGATTSPAESRAEASLEAEVQRLRRLLKEEDEKLRLMEEQIQRKALDGTGEGDMQRRLQEFCVKHSKKLEEYKFRCNICMKLFRGETYVHKHIQDRHFSDMLQMMDKSNGLSVSGNGMKPDAFFDADVALEGDANMYTATSKKGLADVLSDVVQDAAKGGDLQKLQHCVRQAAVVLQQKDPDGCTALHLCAAGGHAELVRYLLSSSADPSSANENGLLPLHLAAQEGHANACQVLLEGGAWCDATDFVKSRTPLLLAAANAHLEPCSVLLLHKASPNAQDSDGATALHNAARAGSADLCELVLSWGAAVNASDNDGWCALHEAARWGDGDLVVALLRRGADVHSMSNDGETALHVVPGGYAEPEVVDRLLEGAANLNAMDYDGETPLHVAVKQGDEGLAGVFLEAGADVNARTKAGVTPLDLAKKDEIRWLLRSHKARRGTGA